MTQFYDNIQNHDDDSSKRWAQNTKDSCKKKPGSWRYTEYDGLKLMTIKLKTMTYQIYSARFILWAAACF